MNEWNRDRIQTLLREAMSDNEPEPLRRDLWPAMLQRIAQEPVSVSWLDWGLAALALAWSALSPAIVPTLLFQL